MAAAPPATTMAAAAAEVQETFSGVARNEKDVVLVPATQPAEKQPAEKPAPGKAPAVFADEEKAYEEQQRKKDEEDAADFASGKQQLKRKFRIVEPSCGSSALPEGVNVATPEVFCPHLGHNSEIPTNEVVVSGSKMRLVLRIRISAILRKNEQARPTILKRTAVQKYPQDLSVGHVVTVYEGLGYFVIIGINCSKSPARLFLKPWVPTPEQKELADAELLALDLPPDDLSERRGRPGGSPFASRMTTSFDCIMVNLSYLNPDLVDKDAFNNGKKWALDHGESVRARSRKGDSATEDGLVVPADGSAPSATGEATADPAEEVKKPKKPKKPKKAGATKKPTKKRSTATLTPAEVATPARPVLYDDDSLDLGATFSPSVSPVPTTTANSQASQQTQQLVPRCSQDFASATDDDPACWVTGSQFSGGQVENPLKRRQSPGSSGRLDQNRTSLSLDSSQVQAVVQQAAAGGAVAVLRGELSEARRDAAEERKRNLEMIVRQGDQLSNTVERVLGSVVDLQERTVRALMALQEHHGEQIKEMQAAHQAEVSVMVKDQLDRRDVSANALAESEKSHSKVMASLLERQMGTPQQKK